MSDAAIYAEDLGKRFGDVIAVDGVNLVVQRGTVLGVLGPNGAGKTTAVRMLTTICAPIEAGPPCSATTWPPRPTWSGPTSASPYAAVDENRPAGRTCAWSAG